MRARGAAAEYSNSCQKKKRKKKGTEKNKRKEKKTNKTKQQNSLPHLSDILLKTMGNNIDRNIIHNWILSARYSI